MESSILYRFCLSSISHSSFSILTYQVGTSVTLKAGFHAKAGTSVILKAGFHAAAGTNFYAYVGTCPQSGYHNPSNKKKIPLGFNFSLKN